MSKIRQAVDYERKLTDAQVAGHVAVRQEVTAYERKLTDAQFHELRALQDSHVEFHEREHLLYDDAIEKASSALQARLDTLQADVQRLADQSTGFMTTGRFEREHANLLERVDSAFARVDEKLGAEERVTVRQGAQAELLDKLAANNRWLIGLGIGIAATLFTTVLHIIGVIR